MTRRAHRSANVAVLAGVMLAAALLVVALTPLRPPMQPLALADRLPRLAGCDDAARGPVLVRSSTLLSCPQSFDGRSVTVVGESVGDLLRGPGGRRWVQVNDDDYAVLGPLTTHFHPLGTNSGVAVLLPQGVRPAALGRSGVRGDVIEVVGTFRMAAAEDQGGPAVIARSTSVLQVGGPIDRPAATRLRLVTPPAVLLTLVLLGAAGRRRLPHRGR